MRDHTLVEPFAVQEIFIDGIADQKVVNGIFSCAFYRLQDSSHEGDEPQKVVVLRMLTRACDVPEMQVQNRTALAEGLLGPVIGHVLKLSS